MLRLVIGTMLRRRNFGVEIGACEVLNLLKAHTVQITDYREGDSYEVEVVAPETSGILGHKFSLPAWIVKEPYFEPSKLVLVKVVVKKARLKLKEQHLETWRCDIILTFGSTDGWEKPTTTGFSGLEYVVNTRTRLTLISVSHLEYIQKTLRTRLPFTNWMFVYKDVIEHELERRTFEIKQHEVAS